MKVNLISILNNDGASLDFSGEEALGEFDFSCNHYVFEKPLEIRGKALYIGDTVEFTADIHGEFRTECARCGDEIEKSVDCALFESVPMDGREYDEESISMNGYVADITGAVMGEVFNALPIRYLCSDDCKGLCPVCGANLNYTNCNCES